MSKDIFAYVQKSADKMEACDPLWLKKNKEPSFQTIEGDKRNGDEMVLLHGLLGALSNWESTFPFLEDFSTPIALEFPILTGHRSEVKVKALAAYTEYFIRQRAIQPVTLCGNSLGGHVAMRLCLAAPELVDCLVLSGTSGLYEHSVDSLPVRPSPEYVREHMARVFKQSQFISDDRIEEIHNILKDRRNTLNLIHAARSAKRDNLLEFLKLIKVPTLLLWGLDDEVTTMEVARMFEEHIPNAELRTIDNCGHAPMIEHPEWFADQIKSFLKEHSRK